MKIDFAKLARSPVAQMLVMMAIDKAAEAARAAVTKATAPKPTN